MHKNSSGFIHILLIIVVIIVVAVFVIGKNKLSSVVTVGSPTATQTIDTNSWQTYTNTAFRYTVKVPSDWTIGGPQDLSNLTTFPNPLFNSPCNYNAGDLCSQMFIEVTDLNELKRIDPDYYSNVSKVNPAYYNSANGFDPSFIISTSDNITNQKTLTLDNEKAVGFELFESNYGNGGRLQYVLVTNHNNIKYTFTYEESQQNHKFNSGADWQNKAVFDQILSTFKFLRQATVEGWSLFIDPAGKFTFEYPSDWTSSGSSSFPTLTFMENNQPYYFFIARSARGGPSGDMEDKTIFLDNKEFTERIWSTQGKPGVISIMPETGNIPFNHIEIDVPSTNTSKYLDIFNQIFSTFKFTN